MIPLVKKLRKRLHRNVALAQDLIILETYNIFPKTVVHGGTSIWRCWGSNRFSEDIDVYLPYTYKKPENLDKFLSSIKKHGFVIKKFKLTNDTIFSKFLYQEVVVSFEALFKNIKNFITKDFELCDGNFITVYTLSPEDLIAEKVVTYKKRRKIRDLFDIYFLLKFVENEKKVKKSLNKLFTNFKLPSDVKELKALIIWGAVPSLEDILRELKKWAR